ncbi:hypothetical protein BHU72_10800 [Desulfuribacillus stibiiarsenatis]|uniref:DUF4825 domain-containing protein n=1 Tax=Desulfuribacillus stibiiarsenatis TaxID=1390249 RepID=A0A1E5L2G6_9FIRM|nr:hypothetical protein [Desulfuribacillus stibiiarsenatis]OEH84294.1 hypothetical protein BHU72_10800 [Desulfuribacillus stibiiarsenatis]
MKRFFIIKIIVICVIALAIAGGIHWVIMGSAERTGGNLLTVEDVAKQYIQQVIQEYEGSDWADFKIVDSKITKLEKISRNEQILTYPIELWSLEYRLQPDDISKVLLAGGMNEVDDWITEDSSMGKPFLVVSFENTEPNLMGIIWSGEEDMTTVTGQEKAIQRFLLRIGLLPESEFIGFISNFSVEKSSFNFDEVEWVTLDDEGRLKELNIETNELPNGYYIHNPDEHAVYLEVQEETEYTIINWGGGTTPNEFTRPVNKLEFAEYLGTYINNTTPPFIIITKDGYVVSITEQYVP